MRVALIDPSGFTPPYDHHLCTALASCGVNVRLFTSVDFPYDDQETAYDVVRLYYRFSDGYLQGNGTVHTGLKGIEHIFDSARLAKELIHWDPDVLHFQWLPLPIVDDLTLPVFRRIAPLVHTVHDVTPFHGASTVRLQQWRARAIRERFNYLIVHTENGRSALVDNGFDPERIAVVPHGVLRYEGNQSAGETRRRCIDTAHRVLFFGNIKPYKGVDTLLQAFRRLPADRRSETELYIAGRSKMDLKPLQELAEDLEIESQITWDLGFVPDSAIPSLIQSADIVTLPYREIDQSGVLMTILPYGTPLVASKVGGFPEVLTDGKHGHLVPPDNPDALAQAIDCLLKDDKLRTEMGQQIQDLASEQHSWPHIAEETMEIYKRVVSVDAAVERPSEDQLTSDMEDGYD